MKLTKILVLSFMLTIFMRVKAQAQDTTGHDEPIISSSTASTLPDLIVESVSAADLDGGPVIVVVKNQGLRDAHRSDVQLQVIGSSSDKVLFNETRAVVPLHPGQWTKVIFQTKMGLPQLRYCATADSLGRLSESVETNNRQCGRFSGKP